MTKKIFYSSQTQVFVFSAIAITSAFFVEYFMHLPPCKLCQWQRFPYYFTMVLAIFSPLIQTTKFLQVFFVTYSSNLLLAFGHLFIELGFLKKPTNCSSGINFFETTNYQELLKKFENTKAVTCGKPSLEVLDLSMTGWNLLFCFSTIVIISYIHNSKTS